MTEHRDFVVYAYSRPDWTFYYIGKGRPCRPYVQRRVVKRPEDKRHIHILHRGLDNSTAIEYEKNLILFYGRKDIYPDWGILRNLTDGGEGSTGYLFTDEHRNKLSRSNSGKVRSLEQRKRLSRSKMGEKNPMYGKPSPVKGEKNRLYTPLNWFHPVCGEVFNKSASDLIRMFPEQMLKKTHLSDVRKGIQSNHKGWRTISCPLDRDNLVLSRSGKNHPNYRPLNWFHPTCGEILNVSSPELCKLFPEQSLNRKQLNKVSKGLLECHKGWRPICCPIKP